MSVRKLAPNSRERKASFCPSHLSASARTRRPHPVKQKRQTKADTVQPSTPSFRSRNVLRTSLAKSRSWVKRSILSIGARRPSKKRMSCSTACAPSLKTTTYLARLSFVSIVRPMRSPLLKTDPKHKRRRSALLTPMSPLKIVRSVLVFIRCMSDSNVQSSGRT